MATRYFAGTLSRPTVKNVYDYRAAVDERTRNFIGTTDEETYQKIAPLVELGLHHEQQHEELLVTDIKHILAMSPLRPVYKERNGELTISKLPAAKFIPVPGGMFELGANGSGFAWDNEFPRHKTYVNDFGLMNRLVTCGEFLEFMNDGGYRNPLLWLSDGWECVTRRTLGSADVLDQS